MCDERILWDYIDNELDELQKKQVEVHLDECTDCRDELKLCMALHKEIKKVDCLKPSFRFSKNVMEIIELDVSCQHQPLLDSFSKRLIFGGIGTMLSLLAITTLTIPGIWTVPASSHAFFTSWMIHPGVYTVLAIMIAFWLIFLADKWLQRQYSVK